MSKSIKFAVSDQTSQALDFIMENDGDSTRTNLICKLISKRAEEIRIANAPKPADPSAPRIDLSYMPPFCFFRHRDRKWLVTTRFNNLWFPSNDDVELLDITEIIDQRDPQMLIWHDVTDRVGNHDELAEHIDEMIRNYKPNPLKRPISRRHGSGFSLKALHALAGLPAPS